VIHVFLHDARLLDPHQWEHYWRFPNRPLLTALCQAAVRKMQIFNAQHMANMTWAMATLAHKAQHMAHLALLDHQNLGKP